ncbi:spore cortex formation protein SpoVR/YcgB (stage V sporulation) [Halalkalibacter oceani]
MNEEELIKCKNNIFYFIEKYSGLELNPWQKAILRYYQIRTRLKFIMIKGRRSNKYY